MIFRTILEREAQEIIKTALCANAVEMQIEEQDGSHYVKFIAQTQSGQVAYSAYRASRGGKSQGGSTLPAALSHESSPSTHAGERELIVTSPTSFDGSAAKNPDWYCKDCAKAARLALAAESAPKPDDATWPKPRPISEAPTDGSMVLICLPDSKPQWTMGVFARTHWVDLCLATAIVEPTHFLPLPPEVR